MKADQENSVLYGLAETLKLSPEEKKQGSGGSGTRHGGRCVRDLLGHTPYKKKFLRTDIEHPP